MDIEIIKTKIEAKVRTMKEPKKVEATPDKHFDEYYTTHMEMFEPFNSRSYKSITVLDFLNGKPWDDLALAYVHALRPSSIRVTKGTVKCDARTWHVTVYITEDNIIEEISQEAEVGLPDGVEHGEALGVALQYGIDSPQCKWYTGEHDGYIMTPYGYYKRTKDGLVEFPEPEKDPFDKAGKDI